MCYFFFLIWLITIQFYYMEKATAELSKSFCKSNHMRVSKWWQNIHIRLHYPFNHFKDCPKSLFEMPRGISKQLFLHRTQCWPKDYIKWQHSPAVVYLNVNIWVYLQFFPDSAGSVYLNNTRQQLCGLLFKDQVSQTITRMHLSIQIRHRLKSFRMHSADKSRLY